MLQLEEADMGQVLRSAALSALLGAAALLASCGRVDNPQPPDLSRLANVIRGGSQAPRALPTGQTAIRPRLSAVPSFSAEDARAYAETAGMPRGAVRNVRVTQVAFLSSAQVSRRLGGISTGLPEEAPLCYVEMQGEFTFSDPLGGLLRFERGFEVFDARTGNLLVAGGLPGGFTPSRQGP
jgi:hypothetical protein